MVSLRSFRCTLPLLLLALFLSTAGFADTVISLNQNNLNISGTLGTVTLRQLDKNDVQVSVDFTSYATQLNASKAVDFQTNIGGLGASNITLSSLTAGGKLYNTTPTSVVVGGPGGNGNIGTFQIDLSQFDAGQPNGTTGATEIVFDVNSPGITPSNFVQNASGNIFGVHFCSGTSSGCGQPTGWSWGGPEITTPVPEPQSVALLSSGLIGVIALRRRFTVLSRNERPVVRKG